MTAITDEIELNELERLEFNRRKDIASAALQGAARLFNMVNELNEATKVKKKESSNFWIVVVFFAGLVIHVLVAGNDLKFTWGLWISMMAFIYFYGKKYELGKMESRQDVLYERLFDIEVTWNCALSNRTFWTFKEFASNYENRIDDDRFADWWSEQRTLILENVCGYEKGKRIGDNWAKGDANFRKHLCEMREKNEG